MRDIESTNSHRDAYDALIAGASKQKTIQHQGMPVEVQVIDNEIMYWMTRTVNYSKFGMLGTHIKTMKGLAETAYLYMEKECADQFKTQIILFCDALLTGIDCKSAETIHDKDNRQSNTMDKMLNSRSEKVIHIDDKVKSGFSQALLGKKTDE